MPVLGLGLGLGSGRPSLDCLPCLNGRRRWDRRLCRRLARAPKAVAGRPSGLASRPSLSPWLSRAARSRQARRGEVQAPSSALPRGRFDHAASPIHFDMSDEAEMLRKVDDESVAMAWVHGHGAAGWGAWGGMIDAWGCRLRSMGRQAGAHGAAGWGAWDCRLGCVGLQAGGRGLQAVVHGVAGWVHGFTRRGAWGCRL